MAKTKLPFVSVIVAKDILDLKNQNFDFTQDFYTFCVVKTFLRTAWIRDNKKFDFLKNSQKNQRYN